MNCHEYEADLGDHVDRSLTAARAGALDAHLAGCARCRALVTDFRTLQNVAASLERRTPPEHVWTRIAATVNQQPSARSWWHLVATPVLGWRPIMATGVLVALLAGATWFSYQEVSSVQMARSETTPLQDVEQTVRFDG